MENCYLKEQGGCSSKMSREHYVSEAVLKAIVPNRDITIGGLAWQEPNTLQGIGIGSLQSKVLCTTHNSMLSPLDTVAGNLVDAIVAADKNPTKLAEETEFDGPSIERWFLKTLISSSEARVLRCKPFTEKHKRLLIGEEWPDGWGLYVRPPAQKTIFSQDLFLETSINPNTGELKAAKFIIAGIEFWLLLGNPDHPETWGFFRPRGLIFENGSEIKKIGLRWHSMHTDMALIFTKIGTTTDSAPHNHGWQEKAGKE
jgi:hypothetical protein